MILRSLSLIAVLLISAPAFSQINKSPEDQKMENVIPPFKKYEPQSPLLKKYDSGDKQKQMLLDRAKNLIAQRRKLKAQSPLLNDDFQITGNGIEYANGAKYYIKIYEPDETVVAKMPMVIVGEETPRMKRDKFPAFKDWSKEKE